MPHSAAHSLVLQYPCSALCAGGKGALRWPRGGERLEMKPHGCSVRKKRLRCEAQIAPVCHHCLLSHITNGLQHTTTTTTTE